MLAWSDLFKLNKITHQEHQKIIMILLIDDDYETGSIANLPSNEDALTINKGQISGAELTASFSEIKLSNIYVIAQYSENKWDWFIGYVKDKLSDKHYSAEHLERVKEGNSTAWKYHDIKDT